MKPRPPLPLGPYLVVGLGLSGRAVVPLLAEHGEVRTVETSDEDPGLERLEGVTTLVKSPGVRPSTPLIRAAAERGVDVIGELEIAWRALQNEFIAITGTNGKTTTTEMIGAIHREAGIPYALAGNVGTPLSSLVGRLPADAVVVCEASSFQLADSSAFAPETAVLLNLEPEHLDWHGDLEQYREAKLRVFANQDVGDVAIVPPGFGDVPGSGRRVEYAPATPGSVGVPGRHNLDNAGAAAAVARARGIPEEAIAAALRSFTGVAHRLEDVGDSGGVAWVNDSKATNVASTLVALASFDTGLHLILGGQPKPGEDYARLSEAVAAKARAVYLIGEAAPLLRQALGESVPLHDCKDLDTAVVRVAEAAEPGDTALLSPACASYDQFRNFEERGDRFRELVRQLR